MSKEVSITLPLTVKQAKLLRAGDQVLLSGTLYSARDSAHARMAAAIKKGKKIDFPVKDSIIYYMGPSPARPGKACGAAGPTTSVRMSPYIPVLAQQGLRGIIGKGSLAKEAVEALRDLRDKISSSGDRSRVIEICANHLKASPLAPSRLISSVSTTGLVDDLSASRQGQTVK